MFRDETFSPEKDILDLTGKVILVTGGNAGIGKELILQLAKKNPSHIFLAARNSSKAEAAMAEIRAINPSTKITYLPLDLTSFDSIDKAVGVFKAQSSRLDILMNNAGVMAVPAGVTEEGNEIHFGVNHIGHALLTHLLLPILRSTAMEGFDVRIVNVASNSYQMAPRGGILFDKAKTDSCGIGIWARYGQSKLANILYTQELAARDASITTVAVHPGIFETDLYASAKSTNALFRYAVRYIGPWVLQTVAHGARTQLWAATVPKEILTNGGYYTPVGNLNHGRSYARDRELARRLYEWTQKELEAKGF